MPDIIQTAMASLPGRPPPGQAARDLLDRLNADLGTSHAMTRFGQWRRGERPIPQPVQDWLLRVCLPWAICECGGGEVQDDQVDRLAAMLSPPPSKKTIQSKGA